MSDLPLFDGPAPSRHDHPSTSHEATIGVDLIGARMAVMTEFMRAGSRGLTDAELIGMLGSESARPRRIELEQKKCVERTNIVRLTPSGRKAGVYVATEIGRRAYRLKKELG